MNSRGIGRLAFICLLGCTGPAMAELSIRSIQSASNQVEIVGAASATHTNLEIFARTNLLEGGWIPVASLVPAGGTSVWDSTVSATSTFYLVSDANLDSDGDGLPNAREILVLHTDPAKADTDGDGIGDADELVDVVAYEAWRGAEGTSVAPAEEETPGFLVTANADGGASDPREARLVFKALPAGCGWTRHIRCTPAGKLEFRYTNESAAAWVPTNSEVEIPGDAGADFIRDVAMYQASGWGTNNSVRLEYVVRDQIGRVVWTDAVRLLRPVVLALGDSMTYGFMRASNGTRFTPPTSDYLGWSLAANWSAYPNADQWTAVGSANMQYDIRYQGFRGYLNTNLSGFYWAGENPLGHGPYHMGYNGAYIGRVPVRAPVATIGNAPCYAIVLFFAGLNDAVNSHSAATMYADWNAAVQSILSTRSGKGKTLVVGVTLPRMATYYSGYSSAKQAELVALNGFIRTYSIAAANARYAYADIENVPHDSISGVADDGLHYFYPGYGTIAGILATAVRNGLH